MRDRLLLALLVLLLSTYVTYADDGVCDKTLKVQSEQEVAYPYTARGDRCEGLYVEKTGNPPFLLKSVYAAIANFTPQLGVDILIQWPKNVIDKLHIRATAMPTRKGTVQRFYQMDTSPNGASGQYRWATDVLAPLHLGSGQLGLLTFAQTAIGRSTESVIIPIRVEPTSPVANPPNVTSYSFVILPGVALKEIYVTVKRLAPETGEVAKLIRDKKPLGAGPYNARTPVAVVVPLTELGEPGLFRIEFSPDAQGDDIVSPVETCFRHVSW